MGKRGKLEGCKVLMLIADGYHEHELWFPYYRFLEEGAQVFVAGPNKGIVYGEGRNGKDGLKAEVAYSVEEAAQMDFDVLYLPGGIFSPLELRAHRPALELVKKAVNDGKVTAAICHAQWILVSAGVLNGRRLTCPSDMSDDVINAGGIYLDEECVRDGNLITAVYFGYLPQQFNVLMPAIVEYMKTKMEKSQLPAVRGS
jgi:protease I